MSCNVDRSTAAAAPLARFVLSFMLGWFAAPVLGQAQQLNHAEFMARIDAAQAAASRAGDSALSCDQLEIELVTASKDPALQSYVARSGATAKQEMQASKNASGRAATQTALTILSVVPGGAMAGFVGMAAESEAQKTAAARNISEKIQQAEELLTLMPQVMRGQRIIELAQARKCDWIL